MTCFDGVGTLVFVLRANDVFEIEVKKMKYFAFDFSWTDNDTVVLMSEETAVHRLDLAGSLQLQLWPPGVPLHFFSETFVYYDVCLWEKTTWQSFLLVELQQTQPNLAEVASAPLG